MIFPFRSADFRDGLRYTLDRFINLLVKILYSGDVACAGDFTARDVATSHIERTPLCCQKYYDRIANICHVLIELLLPSSRFEYCHGSASLKNSAVLKPDLILAIVPWIQP